MLDRRGFLLEQLGHGLAVEQPSNETQAFFHDRTLLPGHRHLPPAPRRRRWKVLPMCPVRSVTMSRAASGSVLTKMLRPGTYPVFIWRSGVGLGPYSPKRVCVPFVAPPNTIYSCIEDPCGRARASWVLCASAGPTPPISRPWHGARPSIWRSTGSFRWQLGA